MLYIITEDSNSARCFWDCAAHTFRGKGNYILVDLQNDNGNNREHFANALLIDVTNKINGRFKITKKDNVFNTVGQCWIEDCSNIQLQLNNKHIDNMCGNCKYCCKYNDTKDKLLDLDNKSISKNSTYRLSQI